MIEIEQRGPGLIAVTVTGRIEKADIDAVVTALEAAMAEAERISVLADLTAFESISAEAFIADVQYGLSHLPDVKRYERVAVVTDRDWIEALAWIEGKLIPGVTVRCFEPEDIDDATRFAAGEEVAEKPREPSVHRIATDRADALAFVIDGRMREADVKAIAAVMQSAYDEHDKIDLLIRIDDLDGFDARALFDKDTWAMKSGAFSHLRKYAVVGGPALVRNAVAMFSSLLPMEVKGFDDHAEAEAWTWIGAKPLDE